MTCLLRLLPWRGRPTLRCGVQIGGVWVLDGDGAPLAFSSNDAAQRFAEQFACGPWAVADLAAAHPADAATAA